MLMSSLSKLQRKFNELDNIMCKWQRYFFNTEKEIFFSLLSLLYTYNLLKPLEEKEVSTSCLAFKLKKIHDQFRVKQPKMFFQS